MQEQAAPPRFRGYYPHKLTIPVAYIPKDKFVSSALCSALKEGVLRIENGHYIGKVPKLIMKVNDPEIIELAGGVDLANFDNIDCKDITCTCADKPRYEQLFADTTAERDSIVYNNCKRTIFAAAKRQIKSAPVPSRAVAAEFVFFARMKVRELIGDILNDFGYSFNQWFNHLTYAKQQRMVKVQEYLYGVNTLEEHYPENIHQKLHYEAICKVEVQGKDGKPRMVCAIPDLIKYVMGPVCWKLEEVFQDHIPTYCGGMNLTQMQDKINHYIDDGFCVVAEGDGSAFDNTQDILLKSLDRQIYQDIADRVYHVPKELFLLVSQQYYKVMDVIANIDKKRVTLMSYAVLGTVFSGDCDTTLMNTLRMGMYNWYTNYKAGLVLGTDFICFSKGDDFTVMYHIKLGSFLYEEAYRKYWLSKAKPNGPACDGCDERIYGLGQILKFIELGPPNTIKFCSLRAWYIDYNSQHIYLTRDPAKFYSLAKYSRKAVHMTNASLVEYLLDQADAINVSYPGLDYFTDMADAYRAVAAYLSRFPDKVSKRGGRPRDRRQTLELEAEQVYDGYLRQARHGSYKVHGSYWETMQRIERQQTAHLTPSQLSFVNNQINAEFLDRDLKDLIGFRPQ